jgi:hypothetical protein
VGDRVSLRGVLTSDTLSRVGFEILSLTVVASDDNADWDGPWREESWDIDLAEVYDDELAHCELVVHAD